MNAIRLRILTNATGEWSVERRARSALRSTLHSLLLIVLAAGCDPQGGHTETTNPGNDFDALYSMRCAGCHGADGKFGPAPPLNDPIFLAIVPDAELLRVIKEGRAVDAERKSLMPAFGLKVRAVGTKTSPVPGKHGNTAVQQRSLLNEEQIKVVVAGLKKRWGPPAAGSLPPYVSPSGGLGGDKDKGARIFARSCAGCHGPHGEGEQNGRPLDGGMINNPDFLTLISDQALRRIIITGRPDLGMPAYNDQMGRADDFRPLTSAAIDDLVALLAYWRRGTGK